MIIFKNKVLTVLINGLKSQQYQYSNRMVMCHTMELSIYHIHIEEETWPTVDIRDG